jgi:hypothetical protein
MATINNNSSTLGVVGNAAYGSASTLCEYWITHKVWETPLLGCPELQHCTCLILFNVQGFMVAQVWTELRATLGELAWSIVQIKQVSDWNRNPHMDMWVWQNVGAALVSVIWDQTRTHLWRMFQVVMEAQCRNRTVFAELDQRPGSEECLATATHW